MGRWLILSLLVVIPAHTRGAAPPTRPEGKDEAATRGKKALLTKSYNPPTMAVSNRDNAWKNWGLKQKPDDFDQLFRERYGLHPAPYPNDGLPMGLRHAPMKFSAGKGLTTDCLLCHGGSVFGQSYVGLGNASLDMQSFYEEVVGGPRRTKPPFTFSNTRGTVEAGGMSVYLLGYREPDLSLRLTRRDLDLNDDLCEDVPAWWILHKKRTMYHNGGMDVRSSRSIMQFMMSPLNFASAFPHAEKDFEDIREFLVSLRAPKYPLAIDEDQAAKGEVVFRANCAKCHGTYGEKWTYPNKVIPLEEIGTDRRRFEGVTKKFGEAYDKSWFAKDYKSIYTDGYQAPPLDGIWATAPYLHNGSVPTLYNLLNSKTRPKVFTRSYATDGGDYDEKNVGWKVTVPTAVDAKKLTPLEYRKVYDTRKVGRSNGGHTYGDKLSEAERMAVIEYLKTL